MTPPPIEEGDPRRRRALVLSWLAYATYYLGRKAFSAIKEPLERQLGVSPASLGAIDAAFYAAYAVGQFPSGALGDRVGPRRLVGYGLLLSALACAAFGLSRSALAFGVCYLVNGFAQSSGWPGTTRVVAEWTTPATRGSVMGVWATCYQVGGFVATPLAGFVAESFGWRWAMLVPSALLALMAFWVLARLPTPSASSGPPSAARAGAIRAAQLGVLKSATLWLFGLSYLFIKLVRYALLSWLPYYFSKVEHYQTAKAASISVALDAGGVVGVIVIGKMADRPRRFGRAGLALVWLLLLVPVLFAYSKLAPGSIVLDALVLALLGALLFGPDSLLSGVAAQDAADPAAAAMATGFVNGIGSFGAVVQGLIVPTISHRDWRALFPALAVFAFCAMLALVPTLRRPRPVPFT
jgi:sugar phosphate permease